MTSVTVILTVEERSGILSSAVTSLRRFGLNFERHRSHEDPDTGARRMVIEASGTLSDPEGLAARLQGIRGVLEVEPIGTGQAAGTPAQQPAPAAQATVEISDQLVADLVADYPRIMPRFEAFELELPADNRQGPQRELGRRVGAALAPGYRADLEASLDLGQALENVAVPALDRLAQAQVTGDDALEVPLSSFTRRYLNSMDLTFGAELDHCWFLSGLLEGLLEASPHFTSVQVNEERCRAVGDETCRFRARLGTS